MGMFNHIKIDDLSILPISESVLKNLKEKENLIFQTKNFECLLDNYIILNNIIVKEDCEWENVPKEERPYPNDTGILSLAGSLRKVNCQLIEIKYHGILNFYTYINKEWFEFDAKFTDGKLVEIIKIEESN